VEAPVDETAPLRKAGAPDGPTVDEAIALLRRLRGTQDETAALEAALSAANPPGPVRIACAEILAERGEDRRALDVLEGESSTDALLLMADLFASRGELPKAIGSIERVLARQIAAPGARERHARWVDARGIAKRPARHLDEPTMLNARSGQAPFRLLRQVARGGAGTVYEAEDDVLQRRVAYKVYHGEGADRALVQREIRMIELFAGPGVARAFDASPDDGWIALEWVARGSIRDVIKAGNLDALVPIARWSAPLARALARVHQAGWVHADVKPANVLLRSLDDALLTDFGIARRRGESSSGGSPGYLSPERLGGEPASPLDDVYGFGRVVEDVLQAVARDPAARGLEPRFDFWEQIVRACLGPATHRPMDAAQLAPLIGA
jgi:serine/threonine-protein kinase